MPISTISFGTDYGYVEINDQRQPVPVDDEMRKKIAELSGGDVLHRVQPGAAAGGLHQAAASRSATRPRKGDASAGWLRLGALVLALAALAALLINRRLPG